MDVTKVITIKKTVLKVNKNKKNANYNTVQTSKNNEKKKQFQKLCVLIRLVQRSCMLFKKKRYSVSNC